jgi:hypothetical protein
VPDKISRVTGSLSDDRPFIFCTTTRRDSPKSLFRVCFGSEQDGWAHKAIDPRDCTLPNTELIAEWIEIYDVDRDFVRLHVRDLPPAADEFQFISREHPGSADARTAGAARRPAGFRQPNL